MSHYTHLTTKEREMIYLLWNQGSSRHYIAKATGRNVSTISRELQRNRNKGGSYSPSEAENKYRVRRKACCRKKKLVNPETRALVQELFLRHQWSPEQIANRLRYEQNKIQISFPTIYRGLYAGMLEEHKLSHGARGVARKLRHRGKTRHRKGRVETRGKIKISNRIEDRPEEANNRSCIGHWEADTVAGKTGSSCLITLTDRCSRFLLTKRIPKKTSKYVRDGMIELLQDIPSIKLKSITPDRGMEFTLHAEITAALDGIPFFFPRPHAPWERGTNENTNGLIREYCPKSVDMDSFDAAYFIAFTNEINLRPRKCLGWKSPYEVFFHSPLHLT